jgi:hypothetical protein
MRFVDPQSALAGFLEQDSMNREQGLFPTFERVGRVAPVPLGWWFLFSQYLTAL